MIKNKNNNQKSLGIVFGLIAMGIYGLFSVFSHSFVQTFDPFILGGLATFFGSLPLVFNLFIKGEQKYLFGKTKYTGSLFAIAIFSGIATLLFLFGTKLTTGINTGLLSQIEPIYSVILAYFVLGEKRRIKELGAIFLMVIGASVVVFKGFSAINIGDLLILLTPVFYQLSHLFSKDVIAEIPDINIIPTARLFYGGIILTIIGVFLHPSGLAAFFAPDKIVYVIIFSIIFRTFDNVLWYQALSRLPLSITSSLIPVSLPVAYIGSIVILGEIPTLQQNIGFFAILFGLIWISFLQLKEGN